MSRQEWMGQEKSSWVKKRVAGSTVLLLGQEKSDCQEKSGWATVLLLG